MYAGAYVYQSVGLREFWAARFSEARLDAAHQQRKQQRRRRRSIALPSFQVAFQVAFPGFQCRVFNAVFNFPVFNAGSISHFSAVITDVENRTSMPPTRSATSSAVVAARPISPASASPAACVLQGLGFKV